MNVLAVRSEVARRLSTLIEDSYIEFPANPVFPCTVVKLPTVQSFHSDFAHSITNLEVEVGVYVGRGDLNDAQRQIGEFVSTDTPNSILVALEALPSPTAWHRLKVVRTSELIHDANALGVLFFLEIDA
jgi:hypothetical protein